MGRKRAQVSVAIGCAVHSGWAAAVAAIEQDGELHVVGRERFVLVDPDSPEARFPYHSVAELPGADAARRVAAHAKRAAQLARGALAAFVDDLRRQDHAPSALGVLDAGGRPLGTIDEILRSHALIHAAEGEHFRAAVAGAAQACGLKVARVRARDVEGQLAAASGRSAGDLQRVARAVGRGLGPPWTADHRAAALLAWLVLRQRRPSS